MMRCPFTDELQSDTLNTTDLRVAEHLAACPACRDEWARQQRLQAMLATLPAIEAPAAVAQRLDAAALPVADLTCDETLELLEAYRDGALSAAQTFLVEEHLLWCTDCAEELERADRLGALLATLPQEPAPAAIAERIAIARQPWWQRLLAPAPAWGMGFAAAAMLAVAMVTNFARPTLLPVATHTAPLPTRVARVTDVQPRDDARRIVPAPVAPTHLVEVIGTAPVISHPEKLPVASTPATPVIRPTVLVRMNTAGRSTRHEMDASRAEARVDAVVATVADYTASAREDLSRMARETELASIEESLSNAPIMVASTAHRRSDTVITQPSSPVDDSLRATEFNRSLNEDLQRRKGTLAPQPMVIRGDDRDKATGVLMTIK